MAARKKGTHPLLEADLAAGRVEPVQLPKSAEGKAEGYAYFKFLGGIYDGVTVRLYAPFEDTVTFNGETYHRSPPENGRSKRLTYRTEGYEPPKRTRANRAREETGGSDPASRPRRRLRTVVTTERAV